MHEVRPGGRDAPLKVSKVIAAAEQGMRKGHNYDQISKDISLTIDL